MNKYNLLSVILFAFFISLSIIIASPSSSFEQSYSYSFSFSNIDFSTIHEIDNNILQSLFWIGQNDVSNYYEWGIEANDETNANIVNSSILFNFIIAHGKDHFWALAGILIFVFGGWRGKVTAATMLLSFITVALIVTAAKEFIERERPSVISEDTMRILQSRSEYSFPSGHASIVSTGAVCVGVLFWDSKRKKIVSLALAIEAVLVCIVQLLLGVHYFFDIIGGAAIGLAVAFGFIGFVRYGEPILSKILQILRIENLEEKLIAFRRESINSRISLYARKFVGSFG